MFVVAYINGGIQAWWKMFTDKHKTRAEVFGHECKDATTHLERTFLEHWRKPTGTPRVLQSTQRSRATGSRQE
jgi:hypothetical protein